MPAPIALASTFDRALARLHGATIGNEARSKGNDVVFAPTVNLLRTPLGGRSFEAYGEDPYLMARIGGAMDRGAPVAGRDRQRQALRRQQPGGRAARHAGRRQPGQPPDRERGGRRAHAARDVPVRTSRRPVKRGERRLGDVRLQPRERRSTRARTSTCSRTCSRASGASRATCWPTTAPPRTTAGALNNGLDFEPWPGVIYWPALGQRRAARRAGRPRRPSTSTCAGSSARCSPTGSSTATPTPTTTT